MNLCHEVGIAGMSSALGSAGQQQHIQQSGQRENGQGQPPRPVMPPGVSPVPIRMQDIQAAIASGGQLLGPAMSHQHPYFGQPMVRPGGLSQGPEGPPVQGFQQLLGAQQLNQYHQRGLLQGQQSKAAMGQQGLDKAPGLVRPTVSLAPLPTRPFGMPGNQGFPGPGLNLAPLPTSHPYLAMPQAGSQPWGLPHGLAPGALGPQREGHPGSAFLQPGSKTPDQATLPSQSPQPHHGQSLDMQRAENGAGAGSSGNAYPQGMNAEPQQPGMPMLPGAQQDGKTRRSGQVHFIPPGSAVVQPGPSMIHPGSTYNDAVWPPCHGYSMC